MGARRLMDVLTWLMLLILTEVNIVRAGTCTRISLCSCESSYGIVDLSSIANRTGPAFKDVLATDGQMYSYNPCHPFNETSSTAFEAHCQNVAACQVMSDGGVQQYYDTGTQGSVTLFTNQANKVGVQNDTREVAVALYTSDDFRRQTEVIFLCNEEDNNTTFTAIGQLPEAKIIYRFILKSPACCFKPVSSSPAVSPTVYGALGLVIMVTLLNKLLLTGIDSR